MGRKQRLIMENANSSGTGATTWKSRSRHEERYLTTRKNEYFNLEKFHKNRGKEKEENESEKRSKRVVKQRQLDKYTIVSFSHEIQPMAK